MSAIDVMAGRNSPAHLAMVRAIAGSATETFGAQPAMAVVEPNDIDARSQVTGHPTKYDWENE